MSEITSKDVFTIEKNKTVRLDWLEIDKNVETIGSKIGRQSMTFLGILFIFHINQNRIAK